ncbi:MAG: NfeD family protein [Gammaproteobacteria bacterium]|nr:NfeD family protein [Rhodocyclaceae bacterium]MBU3908968.1 NfeD family protein [Gammaproteobacteria bacterium]MBU3988228.1 NfeD family protein [Gammaproteobacteria bacterium]MBU4005839.1 NfeD family protein [Gammaproteobacteria bacterium]MBU4021603.1 NfeD family protein [Gammaproteobacteria bacterium]
MEIEWWHWAVGGLALIVAELVVPAFVVIWFGLGALVVAAVVALAAIGTTAQLALWLVVSVAMVAGWFKVFKPNMHKTRIGMADANVVGEVGMLVRNVAPFEKGQVRFQKPILGADVWECIADEAIKSGERVRVLDVEGSFLKVGRAEA